MSTVYLLGLLILILLVVDLIIRFRSIRNKEQTKTLNLLQKLSDIIISSITDIETVAQKVSDAIAFDLGFQVGVILLIDDKRKILKRVAISRTERVQTAVWKLGFHFKGLETLLSEKDNITVATALDGIPRKTNYVYEVLAPHVTREQADYIQDIGELASSFVFPIHAKGNRRIGVMIFSISKNEPELTDQKRRMIVRVLEEVGIALENASLYQDLKITSAMLEEANQKLKILDKLKDEFVSVASHELRTPMTAIRSYVWMALHKSDIPLSQNLKRYLYRTLISTERLINLVNDMLNVSRIESGHIEIKPRSFDIVALVKEVMEEIKAKAMEKRLQLLVMEHKLPPVFADPDKVHEVLLNLLGNCLKFDYPGGQISVDFFTEGKEIQVSVKDNGLGITREDLGKLFKKFGRLDNSYVSISTSGGTGLGLYISRSLIEMMHGKIWAESEGRDKGSTFSFSLPVATNELTRNAEKYRVQAKGEIKQLEPVAL